MLRFQQITQGNGKIWPKMNTQRSTNLLLSGDSLPSRTTPSRPIRLSTSISWLSVYTTFLRTYIKITMRC